MFSLKIVTNIKLSFVLRKLWTVPNSWMISKDLFISRIWFLDLSSILLELIWFLMDTNKFNFLKLSGGSHKVPQSWLLTLWTLVLQMARLNYLVYETQLFLPKIRDQMKFFYRRVQLNFHKWGASKSEKAAIQIIIIKGPKSFLYASELGSISQFNLNWEQFEVSAVSNIS